MKYLNLLLCTALLTIAGCKKDNSTSSGGGGGNSGGGSLSISDDPQANALVDGVNFTTGSPAFYGCGASSSIGVPPDPSHGEFDCTFFAPPIYTMPTIAFNMGTVHWTNANVPPHADFQAAFTPGSKDYTPGAEDGVQISWYDNSGVAWTTDNGSMDQTSSSFVVHDVADASDFDGSKVKIHATFNCIVYHPSNGQQKTITNGEAVFILWAL